MFRHVLSILPVFSFFYLILVAVPIFFFFFFNDTATTEIYTLSLHDALPICRCIDDHQQLVRTIRKKFLNNLVYFLQDRKSTRLNSSHQIISYAVFCLKKKKSGLQ